jgi:hypothetical protein
LTANAVADTSCTLIRPGKWLINPATLLKSYFTVEEFEGDIDESTVAPDCVRGSIKFSMSSANNLLTADPSLVGTGQIQVLGNGASPMFANPVAAQDSPFSVVDATIRLGGVDLVELTSFDRDPGRLGWRRHRHGERFRPDHDLFPDNRGLKARDVR